ncbi:NAD(P)/FAD-dependent oxidoreductase [Biformimicrobium ophioploci]|uniref:NAD(P)/FAD-dependent oxidoreductase n=1 Tax=Biformimicrobium ophioploci TaxID=3036711 RepID=A0ABQ6LXB8_9GAMM|nr:NAD(P)/FAD-dependent oxidoreductase [Microbulbifer sp. NKW57]GMG86667.1 NAD(P)/FAD-dependent oxidoreductase [Microbulbifer sp. NKW57]
MSDFPSQVDVLIIGAGAAGLMCAAVAGQRGRSVLVVDHANKVGKKILMSGGGRCNFTNYYCAPENYYSANPHFCKSALARYTQWDFIALVEKHGIPYHEKTLGQLFCDNKSRDILDMLLAECRAARAQVRTKCGVDRIEALEHGYLVHTALGRVHAESLVVATGGLSIPTMGATGFGFDIARQFGLKVLPTYAALVPFVTAKKLREAMTELAGSATPVVASCAHPSMGEGSFREAMLVTHKGLSGPAVLQISSYWKAGLPVDFNLYPDGDLGEYMLAQRAHKPDSQLLTVLSSLWTRKLAAFFLPEGENRPLKQFSDKALAELGERLQTWRVWPEDTEGYRTAEVTMGGVDTDELSSRTMESKKQPGLYFIGEVVDVTGWLGGYNFQWAWSSAHAAGEVV